MNFLKLFQVVNLSRFALVNLNRFQVVNLNRSEVVNFIGFCTFIEKLKTLGLVCGWHLSYTKECQAQNRAQHCKLFLFFVAVDCVAAKNKMCLQFGLEK